MTRLLKQSKIWEKEDEPKQSENVEEKGVASIEDGTVAEAIKDLRKMEEPKQSENVEEKGVATVAGAIKELEKVDAPKGESSSLPSDGTEKEISKGSEKVGRSSSSSSDGKGGESSLMNEEKGLFSDLKEHEKKALTELRLKIEEAILKNRLFKGKNEEKEVQKEKPGKENDGSIKDGEKREFKVNDAFEMLKNTLKWRKENKIDSIMEEDFGNGYDKMAYTRGLDREGHMVCYNVYGVLANDEVYDMTTGTEATRGRFLRWRFQLMEQQLQKLDFKPSGISSLLQINDLKNTAGPSRKDLWLATKKGVGILQDNYPEFVARNIFINVPSWYYAFNALLSPFLTQRTKSKFVFSRPARVTETLLKYISVEEIPVHHGGLRKENDPDFSIEDAASEITVKPGVTETIEIPAPEVGNTLMWDLTIVGWDVNYKEEIVPTDERSYTVIVKKGKKITWQEDSLRNSFRNNEPGKVVITVENGIYKKKRYKTVNTSDVS
ncbi:unnamed protein product [Fraxinus pennsylvanica]|uniref:Patellin-4 n=1 Tax=Fraxinus pennsylvanica TaxID=56036 RepID=A0AAD2AA44_9LAMI|nr:unnamed protein product [Fraxinus pennsylvanica]